MSQAVQLRETYGTPHVIWMQLGIESKEAAELARKAGLIVIMDKCIMMEHKRIRSMSSTSLQ